MTGRPATAAAWRLGGFLARRSHLATRYLSALAGASLAVALTVLAGVLGFLDAAAERADGRRFGAERADGCIIGQFNGDVHDERQYERIVLARRADARCTAEEIPPGLDRFPQPDEVFVSPEMLKLRASDAAMVERYPRVDGVIGERGLIASDELRVIVGVDEEPAARTMNAARFDRFGAQTDWTTNYLRTDPSSLRRYGILFVVPLSMWLICVATLINAKMRQRQLSVLAVVGLGAGQTCRVLVAETALTVGAGALVGLASAKAVLRTATPNFAGLTAFPGDFEPSITTLALVLVAVVGVAVVASTLAAVRSVFSSRSTRFSTGSLPPLAGLILLGASTVLGLVALWSFGLRVLTAVTFAGQVATFAGLLLIVPALARTLSSAVRSGRMAIGEVIGSRLARPAGTLTRAVGAFAGGLFVVSLAQTTIAAVVEDPQQVVEQFASDGRSVLYVRYPDQEVLSLLRPYASLAGMDPADGEPQVLTGSCATLRAVTGADTTTPCPPDGVFVNYVVDDFVTSSLQVLDFAAAFEPPVGPRGDALIGHAIRLTEADEGIVRADSMYIPVPAEAAPSIYNGIIAADQAVGVRIIGSENVTGTTELNSIADIFRWGGWYATAASIIAAGIALVSMIYDRRRATSYLEILGVSRPRSAIAIVSELLLVASAAASVSAVCAWIWGSVYALARDVSSPGAYAVLAPYAVGVAGLATFCIAIVALSLRARPATIIDAESDQLERLKPFAVRSRVPTPRRASPPLRDGLAAER